MDANQEYNTTTNQLIQELIKKMETNQENLDLLKGYITVLIDRETSSEKLTNKELLNMYKICEIVPKDMFTILEKQEMLLNENKRVLLKALENGKNEMHLNNQQVVNSLEQIQLDFQEKITDFTISTNTMMDSIYLKSLESLGNLEARSTQFISNTKKRPNSLFWLHSLKYGFSTTLFIIPTYLLLRFLFSLLNIDLP
ncbi:hypothetical protein SPE26_23295 [Bacillus thuringiensis]|uniref:Uncharacterized protein n=1 Tax=Bacillus thuringiensis TaxID=1428 RepID=A0AAW9GNL2_BACTU|nr:hypothetical protein [Bacillus thuringiensis]MDY0854366.1 hypothetical protein [Bacillus thuringiensis]MDY4393644.1 hypothetical protein [Bacillus thuringiensis]